MIATASRHKVATEQRFSPSDPCPVCGGWQSGSHGSHCYGCYNDDRTIAYCEIPNGLGAPNGPLGTYSHLIGRPCACGETHGAGTSAAAVTPSTSSSKKRVPYPNIRTVFADGWKEVARYPYHNADGTLRYYVVRYDPPTPSAGRKKYYPWQQLEGGQWVMDEQGIERVLYRLPELRAAEPHRPVHIAEGEKCANALAERGLIATTSPGGAKNWHQVPGAAEELRDRHVVIHADNDEKGRAHARQVAEDLRGIAASVRIVFLPGLAEHGDVADWFAAGGTAVQLLELVISTAVEEKNQLDFQPSESGAQDSESGAPPIIDNVRLLNERHEHDKEQRQWEDEILAHAEMPDNIKVYHLVAGRLTRQVYSSTSTSPSRVVTGKDLARRMGCKDEGTATKRAKEADENWRIISYNREKMTAEERASRLGYELSIAQDPDQHSSISRIARGPQFARPADVHPITPPKQHGGKREGAGRKRKCSAPDCGSTNIEERTVLETVERMVRETRCRDCGSVERAPLPDLYPERTIRREPVNDWQQVMDEETDDEADGEKKNQVDFPSAMEGETSDAGDKESSFGSKDNVGDGNLISPSPEREVDATDAREALLVPVRQMAAEMNYPAVRIAGGRVTLAPTPAAWEAYLTRADAEAICALLEALDGLHETAAG